MRPCPSCCVITVLSSLVRLVQPAQPAAAAAMGTARVPVLRSNERNHLGIPGSRQSPNELRQFLMQDLPRDVGIVGIGIAFCLPCRIQRSLAGFCQLDLKLPAVCRLPGPADMP